MNKFRLMSVFVVLAMLFSFVQVSPAGAATTTVTLQQSTATISQAQNGLFVYEAVDGITDGSYGGYNGWATFNGSSDAHTAVWETSSDVNASRLDFALYHTWAASHSLGHFRLSYTTDDRSTFADGLTAGGDITANWIELTGATVSSSCACGDTFTVNNDNSILVGGTNPDTNIYYVSFTGNFSGVTGIRLEALTDPSLPTDGPGRGGNGNWHLVEITLDATPPSPLDDGGWELVAHMSNSGGMFDGNGELLSNYSYGTFVANPVPSTPDFQGAFPVVADKILFITGDLSIWGIADYGNMRALIDAPAPGSVLLTSLNLAFEIGVNGIVSNTTGNVLSRTGVNEDPWISMDGDHNYGRDNERIVWGENNYGAGIHQALKNGHGGINVYVKAALVTDTDGDGVPDDEDSFPNDETRAVNCDPGYYGAFECTPAPAGTFVDSAGSLVATPCAIGTYQPDTGKTSCVNAAPGSFVDVTGAVAANPCPLGYYQPAEGAAACLAAPIGSFVDTVGAAAATACPAGSTTVAAASTSASDCNFPPTAVANGPYLVAVDQQVMLDSMGSSDPDLDPLTETWTADGGTVSGNVFTAGSVPGIYDVQLVVNDGTADSLPATTMVVVYDPSGGFVTGGGWIDSPAGAYTADPSLTGKANFGFVAKYKKGANVPDGNTEFQFKAGDLNFKSSSYEWLLVAGNQAMFKGEGTINEQGSYKFMITADDDNPDTFRIKIWYEDGGEVVVYDNGSQQALGGGSVVIHNK